MRRDPIYHSTYTGKPPDEPAVLGVALNEVFVPILQKQFLQPIMAPLLVCDSESKSWVRLRESNGS